MADLDCDNDPFNDRGYRSALIWDWGVKAFGIDHMTSVPQRGLRLAEEAIELAQACDVKPEQLHKLIDYVYSRPVGPIKSEIGGVSVCLLALSMAVGVDADECEVEEINRVLSKPIEHFTKRNKEKNDAGFKAV